MKFPRFALALALIATALLMAAGPGTRIGLWDFRTGFQLLAGAAFTGVAAAACAFIMLLIGRLRRAQGAMLGVALVLGLGVAFVPWNGMRQAKKVPPIHDISTDTTHAPALVAILPLRAAAPNAATYGGPEIAEQQAKAYPDIGPYITGTAPALEFDHALKIAHSMGWVIVASDPASGRIEATATTPWFGFRDDVVIRIEPAAGGSRVDIRSVSRVGQSDVGTNARRIRAFMQKLAH